MEGERTVIKKDGVIVGYKIAPTGMDEKTFRIIRMAHNMALQSIDREYEYR